MVFMPTRLPTGSRIMLANLGSEFEEFLESFGLWTCLFFRKVESKKRVSARHVQVGDDGFGSCYDRAEDASWRCARDFEHGRAVVESHLPVYSEFC